MILGGKLYFHLLLPKLNFARKAKSERKYIKEGKRRNAFAFQVFLTQIYFLYVEHWLAKFSWGSNNNNNKALKNLFSKGFDSNKATLFEMFQIGEGCIQQ